MSTLPAFRIGQRITSIRFPEGAPDLEGLTSGLRRETVSPLTARMIQCNSGTTRIEVNGYRRLQSGGLSRSHLTVTVALDDAVLNIQPPEWLLGILDYLR